MEYEYSQRLLEGVKKYVEETGIDFLVFSSAEPESDESEFAYQEWAVSKFFNKKKLDGIIIPTATISRFISTRKASEMIRQIDRNLPVFSIVSEVEGVPSLVIDSEKAFKHLVDHLIVEHHCKNPLVMMVDAVVCVIDELAIGAIKYLLDLGLSVPEDVCVSGFDNTMRSAYCYPSLTSIDQNISRQAYFGAKYLADKIEGRKYDLVNVLTSSCCLRESCGCLELGSIYNFKNENGTLTPKGRNFFEKAFSAFFVHNNQGGRILDFIDELHSGLSLDALSRRLDRYMNYFNKKKSVICLYKNPVEVFRNEEFNLPHEARIYYALDESSGLKIIDSHQYFDCSEDLLPENYLEHYKGMNIVRVLYHGRVQYGYMILSIGNYGSTEYMMIYSLIAKFIASAYEVTSLAEKNKKLSILSKTDELTGLLNRRGFMLVGQQELNLSADIGKRGLIIYGDIDGLKKINDTYGHAAGDRAILAEVELLKKNFRTADTIGRLGGDEFAVVSISMTMEHFGYIKKRLAEFCEEWNRETSEPFKLSISLGAAEFDSENFNLETLLRDADAAQYIEKNGKKAGRT